MITGEDELRRTAKGRLYLSRKVIVRISPDWLLGWLSAGLVRNEVICVPKPLGLPETARVVSLFPDPVSMSICLVVHDESFEPVPEGQQIPCVNGLGWTMCERRLDGADLRKALEAIAEKRVLTDDDSPQGLVRALIAVAERALGRRANT